MANSILQSAHIDRLNIDERLRITPSPFEVLSYASMQNPRQLAMEVIDPRTTESILTITYSQLFKDVQSLARALMALGIQRDESVAILLPTLPQAVVAFIAASALCAVMPIDPAHSDSSIRDAMELTKCRVIVTLGAHPLTNLRERVESVIGRLVSRPVVIEVTPGQASSHPLNWLNFIKAESSFLSARSADAVCLLVQVDNQDAVLKLARLTRRNLAAGALIAASGYCIQAEDRVIPLLPIWRSESLISALMASLAVGATILLPAWKGRGLGAFEEWSWSALVKRGGTLMIGDVTSIERMNITEVMRGQVESLRAVAIYGRTPLNAELGGVARRLLVQSYGFVETSGVITVQVGQGAPGVWGKPIHPVQMTIGSPAAECAPGRKGDIFIQGPNVFAGYLTPQGVVGEPTQGWLATGDVGVVDESGQLTVGSPEFCPP